MADEERKRAQKERNARYAITAIVAISIPVAIALLVMGIFYLALG